MSKSAISFFLATTFIYITKFTLEFRQVDIFVRCFPAPDYLYGFRSGSTGQTSPRRVDERRRESEEVSAPNPVASVDVLVKKHP